MKYIIGNIIFALLLVTQLSAQNVNINGTVKNPIYYSVKIAWVSDYSKGTEEERDFSLDGTNSFSGNLNIKEPVIAEVVYGTDKKRIYLEPGDNLNIQFDAKFFDWSFVFSGKGSNHNSFLHLYDKEFGQYTTNYLVYEMAQRSASDFRRYMDGMHTKMWTYFRSNRTPSFSENFRRFMYAEMDYWWAFHLLRYRYENPKANMRPGPIVLQKSYYDFLHPVPVQNGWAVKNKYYRKFIPEYLQYRIDHADPIKEYVMVVESNELTVRAEPKTGSRITSVRKGAKLQYLKERSKEYSKIYTRGKQYNKPWVKVRTEDGQIGWVFQGGVEFESTKDKTTIGALSERSSFSYAGKYINGDVLEYFVASELHKEAAGYGNGTITQSDFRRFTQSAQNITYRNSVTNAMNGVGVDNSNPVASSPEPVPNEPAPSLNPSTPAAPKSNTGSFTDVTNSSSTKLLNVKPETSKYVLGVQKETQITGEVKNPYEYSVTLRFYKNEVSFEPEEFSLPLNHLNKFDLAFTLTEPVVAKLIYGEEEAEMFLEPGDDLNISFDGNAFNSSLAFSGKGAIHSIFLNSFNATFGKYSEDFIFGQISNLSSFSFRGYMDGLRKRKWDFYHTYGSYHRSAFSREFRNYIYAQIDYDWGFHLLRYRWEHPIANNMESPMRLTSSYYNFLSELEINNDRAIRSRQYLYFIGLYLKLRQENPGAEVESQVKQLAFIPTIRDLKVLAGPNRQPEITRIYPGDKVKYLYEKSETKDEVYIAGSNKKDYWYKVRTADGKTGWVFGGGGYLKEPSLRVDGTRLVTVEEEEKYTRSVAVSRVDRLRVRRSPDEPNAISIVGEGEIMNYLGRKSPRRYTFTLRGTTYTEYFYQVETLDGQTGWVFGGGISLENKVGTRKVQRRKAVPGSYGNASYFLSGKALYYTMASSIYWKSKTSDPDDIKEEVDKFLNANPHKNYDEIVQEAYYDAIRRKYRKPEKPDEGIASKPATPKPQPKPEAKPLEDKPVAEATTSPNREPYERILPLAASRISSVPAPKINLKNEGDFTIKTNPEIIAMIKAEQEAAALAENPVQEPKPEIVTPEPEVKPASPTEKPSEPVVEEPKPEDKPKPEVAPSVPKPEVKPAPKPETPSVAATTPKPKPSTFDTGVPQNVPKPQSAGSSNRLDKSLEEELDLLALGYTPDEVKVILEDRRKEREAAATRKPTKKLSDAELLMTIDLEPIPRTQYAVTFKGKVSGHMQKTAQVILYPDPLTMKELPMTLFIKRDGTFQTTLNIFEPTRGKLVYGARHIDIFLEPGNNLDVSFSGGDFLNTVRFSGAGSEHNNFIKKLRSEFRFKDAGAKNKVYSSDAKTYKRFVEEAYDQKLAFYEREKIKFSYDFDAYIKGDIDYWYAYSLTNYPWEYNAQFGVLDPYPISDSKYYDFMDKVIVSNAGALPNEYYIWFIDLLLDEKMRLQENRGYTRLEVAEKYLEGEVLYYFKAKRLAAACQSGNLSTSIFEVKRYMEECPQEYVTYRESLKSTLKTSRGLLRGMDAPEFELVDRDGNKVNLSDYRGKVVYLDFWATWCRSCVHQIQNSNYLKKKFGDKEVVFIYISVDRTKREWESYLRYQNLPGIHLYAEGALQSKTARDYAVKRLPAVFLVDQNGVVAQSPAKLPDQPGIVEQISQLLDNN